LYLYGKEGELYLDELEGDEGGGGGGNDGAIGGARQAHLGEDCTLKRKS
jgi:hypothetical protein